SGQTPASSRTSGTDRTASSTTVKIAQPISSTVMYLGETRIQLMPFGSIASLGILPLALGLGSVVLGRVGVFGRELAEALHHQPYHHHDQATAHHSQHGRQRSEARPVEQQNELVHQNSGVPAENQRSGVRAGLGQHQSAGGQHRIQFLVPLSVAPATHFQAQHQ